MRVVALYDIHGNLPALEAVLEDVHRASVDQVVVGGDVFPGPMSNEALASLLDLDLPVQFVRGNGDRVLLAFATGEETDSLPEPHRAMTRWLVQRLAPEHRQAMASWHKSVRLEIGGLGDVLFCHATPRSDTEIFTRLTPEERLQEVLEGLEADLVICGHTHMQFDRMVGGVRVVNAGSVGMPYGESGAHWLMLGPDVQLRRTRYDLKEAAERIRATGYPQAQEFAAHNVLRAPSEQEALEAFTRAERK